VVIIIGVTTHWLNRVIIYVRNIMHQNGTFYIIDFGATRLANGRQLALEPGGYYPKEIGSSGLDLLMLSLSLADWCDTPLPNLLELWLWCQKTHTQHTICLILI